MANLPQYITNVQNGDGSAPFCVVNPNNNNEGFIMFDFPSGNNGTFTIDFSQNPSAYFNLIMVGCGGNGCQSYGASVISGGGQERSLSLYMAGGGGGGGGSTTIMSLNPQIYSSPQTSFSPQNTVVCYNTPLICTINNVATVDSNGKQSNTEFTLNLPSGFKIIRQAELLGKQLPWYITGNVPSYSCDFIAANGGNATKASATLDLNQNTNPGSNGSGASGISTTDEDYIFSNMIIRQGQSGGVGGIIPIYTNGSLGWVTNASYPWNQSNELEPSFTSITVNSVTYSILSGAGGGGGIVSYVPNNTEDGNLSSSSFFSNPGTYYIPGGQSPYTTSPYGGNSGVVESNGVTLGTQAQPGQPSVLEANTYYAGNGGGGGSASSDNSYGSNNYINVNTLWGGQGSNGLVILYWTQTAGNLNFNGTNVISNWSNIYMPAQS